MPSSGWFSFGQRKGSPTAEVTVRDHGSQATPSFVVRIWDQSPGGCPNRDLGPSQPGLAALPGGAGGCDGEIRQVRRRNDGSDRR